MYEITSEAAPCSLADRLLGVTHGTKRLSGGAEATAWGGNVGWQTEIAIWSAGLALVLVCLLRQPEAAQAAAIPGLTLLSIAFGINHLQAGILQLDRLGHWMGAGANFVGVFLSAFYYIAAKRSLLSEPGV